MRKESGKKNVIVKKEEWKVDEREKEKRKWEGNTENEVQIE
jgi:hypothetical protein